MNIRENLERAITILEATPENELTSKEPVITLEEAIKALTPVDETPTETVEVEVPASMGPIAPTAPVIASISLNDISSVEVDTNVEVDNG